MMNPFSWLQMTNMISYQGLVRTFPYIPAHLELFESLKMRGSLSHATRDKGHARRLMAILLLHEGRTITDVHHLTGAARSTIGRWLRWYRDEGIDALGKVRISHMAREHLLVTH